MRAFRVVMVLAMLLSAVLPGSAESAAAPDMLGEWSITANGFSGRIDITSQAGCEFSGTVNIDGDNTENLIGGLISGDSVAFTRAWDSGDLWQDYTGTVTVSGDGASMSGTFSQNGAGSYAWVAIKTTSAASQAPGWYFTEWEYVVYPSDGAAVGYFANGDPYIQSYSGTGEKNDFTTTVTRVDKNGKTIASGSATTTWTDPPSYFGEGDRPVVTVTRTVDSDWGIAQFSISFDSSTIDPGYGTQGKINFATPDGETYVQTYEGTMQAQKMIAGSPGDEKAIILHLNGYGFKYYYEWRD